MRKLERIKTDQFKSYSQRIDDIEFFQGDTITIPFQFIDYNDEPIELRGSPNSKTYVKWFLCPYGQYQNPLVELKSDPANSSAGDIIIDEDTNIVYVNLNDSITNNLIYGKYVQQIVLYYDPLDGGDLKEFRRAQGFVNFKFKIEDM